MCIQTPAWIQKRRMRSKEATGQYAFKEDKIPTNPNQQGEFGLDTSSS